MRFLSVKDRISIVGATGSGKTVAAGFHLLQMPFEDMPVLIFDFKGDDLIHDIGQHPDVHHIGVSQFVDGPGLYVVRPLPHQQEEVEEQLWRVWTRGNMGLYFDEGYMVTGSEAYRACLTQGRSLRIPMISLSQRPKWMDLFSFTEASYYQVFRLNNRQDRKTMMDYIPEDLGTALPEYHSYYYDVGDATLEVLKPVPPPDVLTKRFHARLEAMRPRRRVTVL